MPSCEKAVGLMELVARSGDREGVPGMAGKAEVAGAPGAAGVTEVAGAKDEAGAADGLDDAGADGPTDLPGAAEDAPADSAAKPGECSANELAQAMTLSAAEAIWLLNADKLSP
jgi:hypothetical protein